MSCLGFASSRLRFLSGRWLANLARRFREAWHISIRAGVLRKLITVIWSIYPACSSIGSSSAWSMDRMIHESWIERSLNLGSSDPIHTVKVHSEKKTKPALLRAGWWIAGEAKRRSAIPVWYIISTLFSNKTTLVATNYTSITPTLLKYKSQSFRFDK